LLVGAPLFALATISILGSQPKPPAATHPLAAAHVASLRSLQVGERGPGRLAVRTIASTAATTVAARTAPMHPAPPRPTAPPVSALGGSAGLELGLVNQDRAANGVAALAFSASLARVAQYRAQDMLNRNYFSHYDPATGQLAFAQLLRLWSIPYSTAGENIAWSTNPSMAAINTMFMNSPEHRANILKDAYHRIGIGVATNGVKTMVVEVFSN
jgi:uncharacterized protein YkwD